MSRLISRAKLAELAVAFPLGLRELDLRVSKRLGRCGPIARPGRVRKELGLGGHQAQVAHSLAWPAAGLGRRRGPP